MVPKEEQYLSLSFAFRVQAYYHMHTHRKVDTFLAWYSSRHSPLEAKFSLMCSFRYLNFSYMLYCFPTIKYCLFQWLPQPLLFWLDFPLQQQLSGRSTWLTQAWSWLKIHQSKFSLFSLLVGNGAEETQPGSPGLQFLTWCDHFILQILIALFILPPPTSHWMIQIS